MSSATPSSSTSSPDDNLVEKWRRKFSNYAGLDVSSDERQWRKCEKWKRDLTSYSPAVVFMMKHLKQSGCPLTPDHIVCAPCHNNTNTAGSHARTGASNPEDGSIVLCQGSFADKRHMEETIVHELVHIYDQCKFRVDWQNLRHHACSEIRANALSGECRYRRELDRGHFSFSKHFQACVRRRAVLSVQANPVCPDQATAERVVNEVWESCFNDTRPFDEFY
ncbi:peptidase M76 [Cristinia sonorae]|uniref:Mitochondrial inner membrane protease ATP23 n=1 Tax=Cristinia sonorae TaxID=1940300 RepID=A0A8K0XPM2_9AGAR|nr:peptidase M76 [Cristinia sonorae]